MTSSRKERKCGTWTINPSLLSIFGSSWRLGHEEHAGIIRAWMVPKPIIPTKRWAKEPGVMSRQHETGKLAPPPRTKCISESWIKWLSPKIPNELWFPKSLGYTVTSKSSNSLQLMPSWYWRVGSPWSRQAVEAHGTDSLPSFHGNSSGWHLVEARAARADVRIKLGCPKIFGW